MQITDYLDHRLGQHRRVLEMTILADRVVARPAAVVLDDLRAVLETRTLTGEDLQRLHVMLSQLYHAHAEIGRVLVGELRDVVSTVWEQSRTRQAPLDVEGR